MRWFIVLLFVSTAARADRPSDVGESCSRTADCRAPLRCVQNECRELEPIDEPEVTDAVLVRKTARTLATVAAAASTYHDRNGEWPVSLRELVREGLLRGYHVVDAWGGPIRLGRGSGGVCSAGPDRAFGTRDDQCQ